jgi:hypothetical protein
VLHLTLPVQWLRGSCRRWRASLPGGRAAAGGHRNHAPRRGVRCRALPCAGETLGEGEQGKRTGAPVEANWGAGGSKRVRVGEKVDHRRAAGPPPCWTCLGDTALGARAGIPSCRRRKWMPLEGKEDTDKVGPVGKGEGLSESDGYKFCYVTH